MQLDRLLVYPGDGITNRVTSNGSEDIPNRIAGRFDDFAADLGRTMFVATDIQEERELPSVAEGTMFLCVGEVLERSLARQKERAHLLASRTVLLDVVRTYALRRAEELGLAAAITGGQYLDWKNHQKTTPEPAIYGLKEVARTLGAQWPETPLYESERYALLSHSAYPSLPELLGAYLQAYAALL